MRTLVLTGLPGVGKTEVARIASQRLGFPIIDVAALLQEGLRKEGDKAVSRGRIGPAYIERYGRDEVLREVNRAIDLAGRAIVDAVRLPETLQGLRARGDVAVVLVEAPTEQRLARLERRLRAGRRDEVEVAQELRAYGAFDRDAEAAAEIADIKIVNGRDLGALEHAVGQALSSEALPKGEHMFYT